MSTLRMQRILGVHQDPHPDLQPELNIWSGDISHMSVTLSESGTVELVQIRLSGQGGTIRVEGR